MSKHPSARGKAHGVFSPSQTQTKCVLMRESHQLPAAPGTQHSCCDRCGSHPQETLPNMPRNSALPATEEYCTISEAGDVLGERLFPGIATTRQVPH